jgi:protein-tyrosine phosphatase
VTKKSLAWTGLIIAAVLVALIQFIPAEPVVIPAQLPAESREQHRVLNFEGIANFRDLGGYPTLDGRHTRWGVMYRSGNLSKASRVDTDIVNRLGLAKLIDFRSAAEKEEEPDQLPEPRDFEVVEIPTLDGGDNSVADEIMARIENGKFSDFDPNGFMLDANRRFTYEFAPQFKQFIETVAAAQGEPVLWHCSAGKDRAGFASAILLRILGVPQDVVMKDYMLSKTYALEARQKELLLLRTLKGDEAADKLTILMGVEESWLEAAFNEIDARYGNFDGYVREALGLDTHDVIQLKSKLLE